MSKRRVQKKTEKDKLEEGLDEEEAFYTMWIFASCWDRLSHVTLANHLLWPELVIRKILSGIWGVITAIKYLNKFATSIAVYP